MSAKYCRTCEKSKSPMDFRPGKGTCIQCQQKNDKLRREGKSIQKKLTYEDHICNVISKKYNYPVTVESLKSKNRKREIVFARGLAMLYRNKVKKESQSIAAGYYNREHATLINSQKVAYNMWDTDLNYRQVLQMIESRIGERIL